MSSHMTRRPAATAGHRSGELSPEERARHWEYRLHEDLLLNERQNFFLVAESVLAVAYTEAFSSRVGGVAVELGIAAMALLLTLAWLHVNRRQRYLISIVHTIAIDQLPEFAETYRRRRQAGRFSLGSTAVVAYAVPSLVAVMWVLAIVAAVTVRSAA
jgi:hypothetical protein